MTVSTKRRSKIEKKPGVPRFAQDIYDQIGRGINGGLAYVGAHDLRHSPYDMNMPRIEPDEDGRFSIFANLVMFRPNTSRWTQFFIAIQSSDTYTVWFWRAKEQGKGGDILKRYDDVHCEDLQRIVEETYDEYVKEYQKGWIDI